VRVERFAQRPTWAWIITLEATATSDPRIATAVVESMVNRVIGRHLTEG
jgi:hypothetical protein